MTAAPSTTLRRFLLPTAAFAIAFPESFVWVAKRRDAQTADGLSR